MADHVSVPIRMVAGVRWGHLSALSESHSICGESVHIKENYTFAAGHRVRLYTFKKNVHWRIPEGIHIDISKVTAAPAPRRVQR